MQTYLAKNEDCDAELSCESGCSNIFRNSSQNPPMPLGGREGANGTLSARIIEQSTSSSIRVRNVGEAEVSLRRAARGRRLVGV